MRVAVTTRRRLAALVQFALFAFSASTSLLPCANEMAASEAGPATTAHHAAPAHASHGTVTEDTHEVTTVEHHGPASPSSSDACPWVVGCTGMVQFAIESTWRLLETTPVVSAPIGVTLRAVYAEREVESPPPRA